MTMQRNNTAPQRQPFLEAVCHSVRPERFALLTDEEMKAQYKRGLEDYVIWNVRPRALELQYIQRLGLAVPAEIATA